MILIKEVDHLDVRQIEPQNPDLQKIAQMLNSVSLLVFLHARERKIGCHFLIPIKNCQSATLML